MNDDSNEKNLYKWKRHNSKLNTKIKENDNIRNFLKNKQIKLLIYLILF
jgi:hypothetical protein